MEIRMNEWKEHTPGDPMPVPEDTMVEVRFRNGDVLGPEVASTRLWDTQPGRDYQIIAYRIVEPAKPAERWVSVKEQPNPVDGSWFWAKEEGQEWPVPYRCLLASPDSITHWHPMEQPPEFTPPLTDAEKLAIAVEALRHVDNVTNDGWAVCAVRKALSKIEGKS
jgi:hypothetical protein